MRNSIIGVLALCVFMNWGTGAVAADEPPSWDYLPVSLQATLARQTKGMVMVYRWSAMGRHPVIERAAEARRQNVDILARELPILAQVPIDLMASVPLDARDVEEIWVLTGSPELGLSGPAWIRTNLDQAGLMQRLTTAGWQGVPGSCPDMMAAEVPPPSPCEEELAYRRRIHPDLEEEPLSHGVIRTTRICPRGDGWAEILIPRARPSMSWADEPPDRVLRRLPHEMAIPGANTLMTGVLLVTQDESDGKEPEGPASTGDLAGLDAREIGERILELDNARRRRARKPICDISFSVDETIGGLRLALEGSCPTAFEADMTATTIGMILSLLRVSSATLSPALANELGQVHIRSLGNSVRSEVTVSTAVLLEAIDIELDHRVESRRLWAAFDAARRR